MWFGVFCASRTKLEPEYTLIVENVVTLLEVHNNNLHGYFPSDLGLLSNLERIDVSSKLLYGSLPESIGQWTSILYVNMNRPLILNNNPLFLNGTLPNSIGNWNKLISFDIVGSIFTGTMPQSLSNWNTTAHEVKMNANKFTGSIPSYVTLWLNLTWFDCGNNRFMNGTIPESIGNLRYLQLLDLH
jgi:Leucine-rich repeat (LRR) protein